MSRKPPSPEGEQAPEIFEVRDTHMAPVIYFDGAPNFGNNRGIVNITLAVARQTAKGDGVEMNVSVAAYLRCSIPAAVELREALEKALLMGIPAQGEAN